jgi:hypothetical protein
LNTRTSDKDLLTKGVVIAFIGAAVLLAPYVVSSPAVRDMLTQSSLVGWFALVLGVAFIARWALMRRKK